MSHSGYFAIVLVCTVVMIIIVGRPGDIFFLEYRNEGKRDSKYATSIHLLDKLDTLARSFPRANLNHVHSNFF